jgi:hypothetical protein
VVEDFPVGTAYLLQRVGEHVEAGGVQLSRRQGALVVGCLGQGIDVADSPGWQEERRTEGVADDLAEEAR